MWVCKAYFIKRPIFYNPPVFLYCCCQNEIIVILSFHGVYALRRIISLLKVLLTMRQVCCWQHPIPFQRWWWTSMTSMCPCFNVGKLATGWEWGGGSPCFNYKHFCPERTSGCRKANCQALPRQDKQYPSYIIFMLISTFPLISTTYKKI